MKEGELLVAQVATRGLGQIAALILTGHRPRSLTQDRGILVAVFDATEEVQAAVSAYLLDDIRVPPRAYLGLLRDLKGIAGVPRR